MANIFDIIRGLATKKQEPVARSATKIIDALAIKPKTTTQTQPKEAILPFTTWQKVKSTARNVIDLVTRGIESIPQGIIETVVPKNIRERLGLEETEEERKALQKFAPQIYQERYPTTTAQKISTGLGRFTGQALTIGAAAEAGLPAIQKVPGVSRLSPLLQRALSTGTAMTALEQLSQPPASPKERAKQIAKTLPLYTLLGTSPEGNVIPPTTKKLSSNLAHIIIDRVAAGEMKPLSVSTGERILTNAAIIGEQTAKAIAKTTLKALDPITYLSLAGKATGAVGRKIIQVGGKMLPASIKNPIDEAFGVLFRKSTSQLSKYGEPGRQLATRIIAARDFYERAAASTMKKVQEALGPIRKEEQDNLVKVLDEGAMPLNERVKEATRIIRNELDKVADLAKELKVQVKVPKNITYRDGKAVFTYEKRDFKPLKNYFPHIFNLRDLESGERRQLIVSELAKKHNIGLREAEEVLDQWILSNPDKVYGHLEIGRYFNVPGWEREPALALSSYINNAYKRIANLMFLGEEEIGMRGTNTVKDRLLNEIYHLYGSDSAKYAKKVADRFITGHSESLIGSPVWNKMNQTARKFQIVSKMGLSFIANAPQHLNAALYTQSLTDYTKALLNSFVHRKEARAFAEEVGAIFDSTIKDMLKEAGATKGSFTEKFLKWSLFTPTENNNRIISANLAKYSLRRWFNVLKENPNDRRAQKIISELLLEDPKKVARQESLTIEQIKKAAKRLADVTQFRADIPDLPLWATTPEGRLFTQFKVFAYNQALFLYDNVFGEFFRGNAKPLVLFMTLFPMAGEVVADIRSLLTGQRRPRRFLERYLQNIAWVGGLGVASDIYKAVASGSELGLWRYIGGPVLSDVVGGVVGTVEAMRGKPERLERMAVSYMPIPIVSRVLASHMVPDDTLKKWYRGEVIKAIEDKEPTYAKGLIEELASEKGIFVTRQSLKQSIRSTLEKNYSPEETKRKMEAISQFLDENNIGFDESEIKERKEDIRQKILSEKEEEMTEEEVKKEVDRVLSEESDDDSVLKELLGL